MNTNQTKLSEVSSTSINKCYEFTRIQKDIERGPKVEYKQSENEENGTVSRADVCCGKRLNVHWFLWYSICCINEVSLDRRDRLHLNRILLYLLWALSYPTRE